MNKKTIKMKILFFTSIILLFSLTANAQKGVTEGKAVEKTVINYIENFFENNYDAMNESLHPRLAKRGLNQDGKTISEDFPPEKLKELMLTKPKFEVKHQYNVVENITVFGNMATASLRTGYPKTRWTEYVHLVKLDGNWKIINVFWEFKKNKK